MLKVEPTFRLDRTFFVDHTEFIMSHPHVLVYNQLTALMKRLYLYHCNIYHVVMHQCWRISSHGKKRRRRRVQPRADANDPVTVPRTDTDKSATRSGRVVRKPLRYRVGYSSCPGRTASQQGEVVRNVMRESHVIVWRGKKCEHADLRIFCNYCRDSVITLCIVLVTVPSRGYHK